MKLAKRIATASLALVLALSLTACSPKDMLGNMILGAADLLGLRSEDTGDDEAEETLATPGGSITFPEGMDTQSRFPNEVYGDTLYIAFNGISNRSTDYFVAAGDSVTTIRISIPPSCSSRPLCGSFRTTRPGRAMCRAPRSILRPAAIARPTRSAALTPGKMYKVTVSYDSGMYYVTGGMTVTGIGSEELTTIDTGEEGA